MPNNMVKDLIMKIDELDRKLEQHLIEGTGVKSDILWLKWFVTGIAGGIGAILVSLAIYALKR